MNFREIFANEFLRAAYQNHRPLFDLQTCKPLRKNIFSVFKDFLLNTAAKQGFVRPQFHFHGSADKLGVSLSHFENLNQVYDLLSDEYSKQMFVRVLLHRILGPAYVRMPPQVEEYIAKYESVKKYRIKEKEMVMDSWEFDLFAYPGQSGKINIQIPYGAILVTFLLEQYAYKKSGISIEAKPGDIVIDGGACWGDTALYFADKVGSAGGVWAFEFNNKNIDIFMKNIKSNPDLSDCIKLVQMAVYSEPDKKMSFAAEGPASSIGILKEGSQNPVVTTMSIDALREREHLRAVNFIKMDIEGAELAGLHGAEKTIKECRPNLAISIYHKLEDLWEIPQYLESLKCGYSFYVDHFAPNAWETVLYATAK
jgi:FkbM family methyltransferase